MRATTPLLRHDKPTAIVADPDCRLAQKTAELLRRAGVDVVGRAGDGDSAIAQIRLHRPDIAVIDIRLSGRNGLDVLATMRDERIPARAIMVSAYLEEQYPRRAFDLGAAAYIRKPFDAADFRKAVADALDGKLFVDRWSAAIICREYLRLKKEGKRVLTPSETQVLKHRIDGMQYKEIAAALGKSQKTVEKHLTSIHKKTGAGNDAQLIHYADEHDLFRS